VLKLNRFRYLKVELQGTSISRSFLAVSDQGVISLGNFFTGILLARHLPQSEYGTYALIIGILISANSLHSALIGQPLTVYGAKTDAKGVGQLATGALILTIGISLFLNIAVFVALLVLHRSDLAIGVFGVSLLWQFQEVLRRGLLSQFRQGEALLGDGISYLGQAGLVWFLIQQQWLSLNKVFAIMMLTSVLAACLQALQIKIQSVSVKMVIDFARLFWNFGRWILLTNVMTVILLQIFPWSLRLFHGPEATASFQVIVNVLGVSNPIIFSLGTLIITAITHANAEGNRADAAKIAWKYALPLAILLLIYYVVLIIWPGEILAVFYGSGSPYLSIGLETPLRILVLAYSMMYCSIVFQSVLYGIKNSRAVFQINLVSTCLGLIVGIPMVSYGEVRGACSAIFLIQLISLVTSFWFFRKRKVA
jgi:O-antigen/teichoic acid export membrane protein